MTKATIVMTALSLSLLACGAGGGDDDATSSEAGSEEEVGEAADEDLGEEVDEAIEDSGVDDLECLLADDVVAEAVGEDVTDSGGTAGGSGGGSGDVEFSISYAGCNYTLASGGVVTVAELVDTDDATALEGYEQVTRLVGVDDDAVAVPGLGDDAVQNDDDLVILAGDRAFYLTGETEAGDDIDPAVLQALGAELVAAETG